MFDDTMRDKIAKIAAQCTDADTTDALDKIIASIDRKAKRAALAAQVPQPLTDEQLSAGLRHAIDIPTASEGAAFRKGARWAWCLRAAQVPQWMPIESAPRGSGEDGPDSVTDPDYIAPPKLLLWTDDGPVVGYYDWYFHPGYGRGAAADESTWRTNEGARTFGVTHWMPIPASPPPAALAGLALVPVEPTLEMLYPDLQTAGPGTQLGDMCADFGRQIWARMLAASPQATAADMKPNGDAVGRP